MTPEYTLTQLLKLEPLNRDDIIKYTGWSKEKATRTIEICLFNGKIAWKHKPSRYVPTMPKPQGSAAVQRLQPTVSDVWGIGHTVAPMYVFEQRRKNEAFAGMVSRLCEVRPRRSGAATAGEVVTAA